MNARYIIDTIKGFGEMDFGSFPTVIFQGELRKQLIERNFDVESAEAIVAQMEVSLPPGSMEPDEVRELALEFGAVIEKMREALIAQGFENPTKAVCNMASQLNIKLG